MLSPSSLSSRLLSKLNEGSELFPMLKLFCCASDAEGSKNGPRYCAQDRFTKCMYEVRCVATDPVDETAGADTPMDVHKKRAEVLITASKCQNLSPSVALPIDVYTQKLSSTGETFIVSVSSYTGLSLGDIIRCGWRHVDELDFEDILCCFEEYGKECMRLPPHRNLSLSAVMRQLNVRSGAVEEKHRSRWVIGDWFLLGGDDIPFSAEEVVGDLEWLLHLAFSKLNVSRESDGILMSKDVVEMRINRTIERIRAGLLSGVWRNQLRRDYSTNGERSPRKIQDHFVVSTSELPDRVKMHQRKLREEQKIIHNYHKRTRVIGKKTTALCQREVVMDDTDKPNIKAEGLHITLGCSEMICNLRKVSRHEGDTLYEQKDVVLASVFEALDVSVKRDAQRRMSEWDQKRMERDALHKMLLRSSSSSSTKMMKHLSADATVSPRPNTRLPARSTPQSLINFTRKKPTAILWSPSRRPKCMDTAVTQVSSSLKAAESGIHERPYIGAASPTKASAVSSSLYCHDVHHSSELPPTTKSSSPRGRELPTLKLRNYYGNNSPNAVILNRKIDRTSPHANKNSPSEINALERPVLGMGFSGERGVFGDAYGRSQPQTSDVGHSLHRSLVRGLHRSSSQRGTVKTRTGYPSQLSFHHTKRERTPLAWRSREGAIEHLVRLRGVQVSVLPPKTKVIN